jgi:hypothetical protein
MRHLSKARQREKDEADPRRQEFRDEFFTCWLCQAPATDIHEMTPGPGRRRGYQERATWIRACRSCHDTKLQPFSGDWTLAGQLAIKGRFDPEHYDRELVLSIKGRASTAVSEVEVLQAAWTLAL